MCMLSHLLLLLFYKSKQIEEKKKENIYSMYIQYVSMYIEFSSCQYKNK